MVSDAVSDLRLGIWWKTTEKNGAPARNRTGICHLGNGRSDPFELRERKFRLAYALPIFCQVASWQSEIDVTRMIS